LDTDGFEVVKSRSDKNKEGPVPYSEQKGPRAAYGGVRTERGAYRGDRGNYRGDRGNYRGGNNSGTY